MKFNDIIKRRKEVLEKEKLYKPLSELKEDIKSRKIRRNFKNSLSKDDDVSIICEYKPASPSAGEISNQAVEDVLPLFERGGASAASILTEGSYFKSNINNLRIACKTSKLPLLRKDFIMDEYQIYESRSSGASAVLFMVDIYPNLSEGILITNYLGMDALVECKNKEEIEKAVDADADIIGINNRSFEDFSIDLRRTEKLAELIPPEIILVSESGVRNADDVRLISSFGADALLVGTGIMGSGDIYRKTVELVGAAKNSRVKRHNCK